jgi:hypothetical protein
MELTRRNLTVFLGLFIPVFFAAFYANFLWFRLFISDRLFSLSFGWIHWPMLLSWIPDAVIFGVSGIALVILLRADKPAYWALTFGALYSLIRFLVSSYQFDASASAFDYFWAYGGHLVPPISCGLAAVYARYHADQRLRNPGPYA